jgi:hypothetical protein
VVACGRQRGSGPGRLCASPPISWCRMSIVTGTGRVVGGRNTTPALSIGKFRGGRIRLNPPPSLRPAYLAPSRHLNGGGSYRRAGKALDWTHELRLWRRVARRHVELWSALRHLCRGMRARQSVPPFRRQPHRNCPAVFLLSVTGSMLAARLRRTCSLSTYHHGPSSGARRMCIIVWVLTRSRVWLR